MNPLNNLKISTSLLLGFGIILLLLLTVAVTGVLRVKEVEGALTRMNDVNSVKQRYAINFRGSVHDRAIALRDVKLLRDPTELNAAIEDIHKLAKDYQDSAILLDEFAAQGSFTAEDTEILNRIKGIEARTLPLVEQVIQFQTAGQEEEAFEVLINQARPEFVTWLATINEFIDLQESKNQTEAQTSREIVQGFSSLMILVCGLSLLIGVSFALWLILSIRPLQTLTLAMRRLAENDLEVEIRPSSAKNEIGDITRAVQIFKDNAVEMKRLEAQQKEAEEEQRQAKLAQEEAKVKAEAEQKAAMLALADQFDSQVGQTIESLVVAAKRLQDVSQIMGSASKRVQDSSNSVAISAEQTSGNISEVTKATSQMTESAQEISRLISDVAYKAQTASDSAMTTSEKATTLKDLTEKIGEVVDSIKGIAKQTNLLALNATIEAAAAGNAGKGFAVVASEVKDLAKKTAEKTVEIDEQISAIQSATQASVVAIQAILDNISDIHEASEETAGAAEQQNAVTSEIAMNLSQVSEASTQTTSVIGSVQDTSEEVGQAADTLATASNDIGKLSESLQTSVQEFLAEVRGEEAA